MTCAWCTQPAHMEVCGPSGPERREPPWYPVCPEHEPLAAAGEDPPSAEGVPADFRWTTEILGVGHVERFDCRTWFDDEVDPMSAAVDAVQAYHDVHGEPSVDVTHQVLVTAPDGRTWQFDVTCTVTVTYGAAEST